MQGEQRAPLFLCKRVLLFCALFAIIYWIEQRRMACEIAAQGRSGLRPRYLRRSVIALPSVPYYGMIDKYGYILLESFTDGCAKDVRRAIEELLSKDAKGLILDLRGNGGGLLTEAVEIVGLFVPKGTKVVETKGRAPQSSRTYSTNRSPILPELPLVVMVDEQSASASEIVSGALQDLDRAVIVGNRTFGKGLVQSTRPLPYNSTLKLTTSKYYIPSGRDKAFCRAWCKLLR